MAVTLALFALSGCGSRQPVDVAVKVAVWGGAYNPATHADANGAPGPGWTVTATDSSGHSWTGVTDQSGVAHFLLTAGNYTLFTDPCTKRISVTDGQPETVTINCALP